MSYRNYGHCTLGQYKEAYDKYIEKCMQKEIDKLRRVSYGCYRNCNYRCRDCVFEIRDCPTCDAGTVLKFLDALSNILGLFLGLKKECHVCSRDMEEDWYYCSTCRNYKDRDECRVGGKFHNFHCGCKAPCCGEKICNICLQILSFCEICKESHCPRHPHKKVTCPGPSCSKEICGSKGPFCSEECEDKAIRS